MPLKANAPPLYLITATTIIQATVFFWGAIRFMGFINFCRAANASGDHLLIKEMLLMIMYLYAPITVISITFSWVGWSQDWWAANVFVWLPFVDIILFIFVVLITKNDISSTVQTQRVARTKLPALPPPPPFAPRPAPEDDRMAVGTRGVNVPMSPAASRYEIA